MSWKFNLDDTRKIFNNTSYEITFLVSPTKLPYTITQLRIYSPFNDLRSESRPLGTTKHQLLIINKYALRGVRIISSNKLNRYHFNLYLKTHLHSKTNILPSLFLFNQQLVQLHPE